MPALDLFPTGRPPGCTSGVSNVAGVTSATKKKIHLVTGAHNRTCCKDHVPNKSQKVYQENNNLIKNLWKKLQHVLFNSVSSSKQDFALTQDIFLCWEKFPGEPQPSIFVTLHPVFANRSSSSRSNLAQARASTCSGRGRDTAWWHVSFVTRKPLTQTPLQKLSQGLGLKKHLNWKLKKT